MEWISVKDKLPDDDEIVLTYHNGSFAVAVYYQRITSWGREFTNSWLLVTDFQDITITPTHWMPLPKPPEL